jgi:hypothetical protein
MNPRAEFPVSDFQWPFPTVTMGKSGPVYAKPSYSLAELFEMSDEWPGSLFGNK